MRFDVHHGNGTQDIFEEDPGVLYISTHQYPHYPGTGLVDETGRGAGKDSMVNIPLPAGTGDAAFKALYSDILAPILRRFHPQFMLISAGYDCHWKDPLASLGLSLEGIAWISQALVGLAEELCDGRIVFALEGGYDLRVLALGVANSVRALLGRRDFVDPLGSFFQKEPDVTGLFAYVEQLHASPS